jgi:glycyl-tRNA synthetase beta chain
MIKNALLEIGTEELPAAYIAPACGQLARSAEEFLKTHRLAFTAVKTYSTPRRLTLFIEGLADKSEDRVEEFTGPSAKAGKDASGNFTPAAKGFAGKHGIPVEKLAVKTTEKGEYLCVVKKIPGEKTEKLLVTAFPELIKKINFPKTMVWEESRFRFARPVRTFLALYGAKVLKFSLAGIKSANWTIGLHTLSRKKIVIKNPEFYLTALKNNCIIADPAERKEVLRKAVAAASQRAKGKAIEDEDLMDEVTNLVEHPVTILGAFDEKYLALPPVVLINCLKKKQKFFAVVDESGKLVNSFIGIRNGISEHQDVVRVGFERVLTARLADAEFFFQKDTRTPLMAKAEKLKGVVFQQKLGTVYDKITRMEQTAIAIGSHIGGVSATDINAACKLAKADLVTDMVFEYPELQGVIGRIYAEHDQEPEQIATAVEEHYWPLTADGRLPETMLSTVLSLADKTDTLVGDFAVGLIPTGSADPYGLRRMAAGILRMIMEKELQLSLQQLAEKAFSALPPQIKEKAPTVVDQVMDFLRQRLENLMEAKGYRFDEIRAVLATGYDDLIDVQKRLAAVKQIRAAADFAPLAGAFKRASNILKQAEKMNIEVPVAVDENLFREDAEKNLYAGVRQMEADVQGLLAKKEYMEALQKMVGLKPAVDQFFEKVMVMADEENIRANRLALLEYATGLFFKILDFSQLQA